jgi:hypothetical protein
MRLAPLPKKAKRRYTDLASKLGHTNRQSETEPLFGVGLEVLEFDVVPVDQHLVNVTVIAALLEEILHPCIAVGVRAGGRASEGVALAGKRHNVLTPSRDSSGNVHVGLPGFIDPEKSGSIQGDEWKPGRLYVLVETHGMGSIAGFGVLGPIVDPVLSVTPEHDAGGNATLLNNTGDHGSPKVDHRDTVGRDDHSESRVFAHSPSNSELSGTTWGGRGLNGCRRRGARWRKVDLGRVGGSVDLGRAGGSVLRGTASGSRRGRGLGLASLVSTLLLGNAVMVRKFPGQMVWLYRESKGLGWSERAEENSECG